MIFAYYNQKGGIGGIAVLTSQRELRVFTAPLFYMVTKQDVENIALLSKLHVPEEELEALTVDMQSRLITLPSRKRSLIISITSLMLFGKMW